jgi:mannosyl-3-phosphoglycerate phosphatase
MVVFSDLDGTLLDHDSYDWHAAEPALRELRARNIPLVLISSKTLAEIAELRHAMELNDPVVAENGAFTEIPADYFPPTLEIRADTVARQALQRAFADIRAEHRYDCEAFYEMGDAGIAAATGLSLDEARLANRRYASEPILWRDTDTHLSEFAEQAAQRGLRCVRGGRFVHLMGQTDKARALAALVDGYRSKWPGVEVTSVALGDGPNDLCMLRAADIAVVIRGKHDHPMPLGDHPYVLRPRPPGPQGWSQAIRYLLDLLKMGTPTP